MLSIWGVGAILLIYLSGLFTLAFWGDKKIDRNQQHPILFSLGLGVHCTSWAFFGTTTQATQYGWPIFPTYIGIMLVMIFAFPIVLRISRICQQHNVSSLADFISLRYNRSHSLAAIITLMSFLGVVPYIALQLDAITNSIALLTEDENSASNAIGFYVAALMALFAILFGTRTLNLAEKHPGLLVSIAAESVVKLVGLSTVGIYVCYCLFDGMFDLLAQAAQHPQGSAILYADKGWSVFISHILLGICAMFILPRQFHMNFVENNGEAELRTARWLFPLYLLGMTLFVLPIGLAGSLLLDGSTNGSDALVLALPIHNQNMIVSVIAFIGGLSATTSMIIVATLALGIMIANNLVTPLWFSLTLKRQPQRTLQAGQLLNIRRVTILVVLSVAFWYHLDISQSAPLVKSGIIAMALLSQIFPIMLFSLYWSRANTLAAICGLLAGFCCWVGWMLYPSVMSSYYFAAIPTDTQLGNSYLLSLLINCTVFIIVAIITSPASHSPSRSHKDQQDALIAPELAVKMGDLLSLSQRILDPPVYHSFVNQLAIDTQFPQGYASQGLLNRVEKLLAGQVGNPSARLLLSALAETQPQHHSNLVHWVEEASLSFQFNHEVLQSSVQHIEQGIAVLDHNLTMLAWNERYIELFQYPKGLVYVGMPINKLLQFNAERGLLGDAKNIALEIEKRIQYIKAGSRYKYLRKQTDGRVIELNGSPLPGGGFVTTYSDITEYMRIQEELENAKIELEARVQRRTQQLQQAKLLADKANESKTKFLAAAGHDLMQPFNAATLFASMLAQKTAGTTFQSLSEGLVTALNSAESLLSALLDMTKLETGRLAAQQTDFKLDDLLAPLCQEFTVICQQKSLRLRYCPSTVSVRSDPNLLRRIVQNLLSNAVRYTQNGAVLVGVRHLGKSTVSIVVIDTGPGIPAHQQTEIFNEFHQLDSHQNEGLGLGLTIVERISHLLGHEVRLASIPGKGTQFSVCVPRVVQLLPAVEPSVKKETSVDRSLLLAQRNVLIIENDEQVSAAMAQLLEDWGAITRVSRSFDDAKQLNFIPDLLIVDYHLDHGKTGIQAVNQLRILWNKHVPGILITANRHDGVRDEAANVGLHYLPKPLKPAALKRLLKQRVL